MSPLKLLKILSRPAQPLVRSKHDTLLTSTNKKVFFVTQLIPGLMDGVVFRKYLSNEPHEKPGNQLKKKHGAYVTNNLKHECKYGRYIMHSLYIFKLLKNYLLIKNLFSGTFKRQKEKTCYMYGIRLLLS